MIDWWWIIKDQGNIYWVPSSHSRPPWTVDPTIVHYAGSAEIPSRAIGWEIIEQAEELDPVSCQLYRLVYGSLP